MRKVLPENPVLKHRTYNEGTPLNGDASINESASQNAKFPKVCR